MNALLPELADLPAVRFAKGHGTENDFVLVPDPDGALELTVAQVARLCDRRAGIGADGLIRLVRASAVEAGRNQDVEWFMDYRNGDGSPAEMCGNGLRVFVAYLQRLGWVQLADGDQVDVGTRAGIKRVRRDGELLAADLGPWRVVGGERAAELGADARVSVPGEPRGLPGLSIDVGNPHVVVALPDEHRLAAADLTRPPTVDPVPGHGTNVELVVPLHTLHDVARPVPRGADDPAAQIPPGQGWLRMRVFERGVGETRSCGTGAVAAALAARVWGGAGAPRRWWVDVPGGRLRVSVPSSGQLAAGGVELAGDAVELAGPAVIVAEGSLT